MPMLTVLCKKCQATVPTGTEMSYDTFRNATFTTRTLKCPKCAQVQNWTTDDVDRAVFPEAQK